MASTGDQGDESESEPADPRAKLMHEVAEEMDALEADFGDAYQIGRVITIIEVIRGDEINLRVRAGQYPWVTLGMLHAAVNVIEGQMAG